MRQESENRQPHASMWVLAMVCVAAAIFALCAGAAYTGISRARLTAAKASIGQIEAVMLLAERAADDAGLGPAPEAYESLLKSYDDAAAVALPPYEKAVLEGMLTNFGASRDFDFAVTRYIDVTGRHVHVIYFPTKGATDVKTDRHYILKDGQITENNT